MKKMKYAEHMVLWTCEARHEHPNCPPENFFFSKGKCDEILDGGLNNARVWEEAALKRARILNLRGVKEVDLYVTGHGAALISAIKALRQYEIKVQLYHYDDTSGDYFRQDPYEAEYYVGIFTKTEDERHAEMRRRG